MTVLDDLIKQRRMAYAKEQEKKVALLSDASKMDKYVSTISQQVSTTTKMAPKRKADLLVDRIDMSIQDDNPMKGFGPDFRQRFRTELSNPKNTNYSARTIAAGIAKAMLLDTSGDKEGKTRLEKAYENYRHDESSRGFAFIGSGKDINSKVPSVPAGFKTYKEWKADRRAEEDAKLEQEYTLKGYIDSVKNTATLGAYLGAAGAAVAGQLGPQVVTPEEVITIPTAAAISGIVAGSAELIAYPFRKMIDKTEWGRARKEGDWKDKAAVVLAKYGPDFLISGGAETAMLKSVVINRAAKTSLLNNPSAKNVVVASEADDMLAKISKKEVGMPLNIKKQKGVAEIKMWSKENNIDLPTDDITAIGKKFGELTPEGKVAARLHPEGKIKGTIEQYEKEEALGYYTGSKTADKDIKNVKVTKADEHVSKAENTVKAAQVTENTTAVQPKVEVVAFKPEYLEGDPAVNFMLRQEEQAFKKTEVGKEMLTVVSRNDQEEKLALAVQKDTFIDKPTSTVIVDKETNRTVVTAVAPDTVATRVEADGLVYDAYGRQIEATGKLDILEGGGKTADISYPVTYHTTNKQALEKIKSNGLRKNTAVSINEDDANKWKISKGNVVLRIKEKVVDGTYDNTRKVLNKVKPENIEVKTDTGWESLVRTENKLKTDPFDYPQAFDLSEHAYIPVANQNLDDVLKRGIAGGKFSVSDEAALKTKKGTNIFRVKKENLELDIKGKTTVTSKTKLEPEDLEVKFEDTWVSLDKYKEVIKLKEKYDAVGDYYDELILKYNPHLEKPTKSFSEANITREEAMTQASIGLEKRLTPEETNKLNAMLTEFDDVERVVLKLKKEIPDISVGTLRSEMANIIKAVQTGKLSSEEALPLVGDLRLRTEQSPTMMGVDKNENLGGIVEFTAMLNKTAGIVKGMLAFGIGAGILEALSPSEAEAFNWSSLTKEVLKSYSKRTITSLQKKQLAVGRIMSDDIVHLAKTQFQTGLHETENGGAKYFIANLSKVYRGVGKSVSRSILTPQAQFNLILKEETGKLINPAVFKATYFNSEAVNIKNGMRVLSNIFTKGGVETAQKEISKEFKHLLPLAEKQYLHDYHIKMASDLTNRIKKLKKADKKTVLMLKHEVHKHTGMAKSLEPEVSKYFKEYQKVAQIVAEKHSSARIFFAADDSIKFEKYPFMRNISLTEKEMLTIGRLKRQMSTYKERLEGVNVKTKAGAFMHYNMHPELKLENMLNAVDSTATPWMKNFSRSVNARPLVPDAVASMQRYIPDVERRIQTQDYWNSGWADAMRKSAHIEPLHKAFQALKEGSQPFENNWTNTAARWYTNIEVFKRLFLSPSAGLKHLVKLTGDMVTHGVRETTASMPSSLRGVSHRIIENTPLLKRVLGKLDNPSSFIKLKKQLLDSVAPAMDTRYRMMQMGFGNYDTYFSKLGVMADQVNHVGGLWINLAELFDRGVTMEAGLRIGAKQGLTPDQALYGIYDTILKNNFLGREFTPQWLRHPKFKALMLFQSTPYKIMERKAQMAIKSKRVITSLGKEVAKITKTAEGRRKLLNDLKTLRKDMINAEKELKSNLILDSLRSEQDFYGNAVIKQFTKDLLIMGAGTAAAGSVGLNMHHHFFHLPFIKNSYYSETYNELAFSPAVTAIQKGTEAYNYKLENGENAFILTEIWQKWSNKTGPFPEMVHKYNRLTQNDIPEIYRDSKFKYLFAIPAKEID